MTTSTACKLLTPLCLTAALALGTVTPAQAGHISLTLDPIVGGTLGSFYSYSAVMDFNVSDACVGSAAGAVVVSTSSCGGVIPVSTALTIYETATTSVFATASFSLDINTLYVQDGFVRGWSTSITPFLTDFQGAPLNTGLVAQFQFDIYLPRLLLLDQCGPTSYGCATFFTANTDGYAGTVQYARDDGSSPLGQDANGNNVGYHITYNNGALAFTPTNAGAATAVPEPGSLALVLGALAAAGTLLRRRRG